MYLHPFKMYNSWPLFLTTLGSNKCYDTYTKISFWDIFNRKSWSTSVNSYVTQGINNRANTRYMYYMLSWLIWYSSPKLTLNHCIDIWPLAFGQSLELILLQGNLIWKVGPLSTVLHLSLDNPSLHLSLQEI